MQIKIDILNEGDEIIDICENRVFVKRKSHEIEIVDFIEDEDGLPRILNGAIITFKVNNKSESDISKYYLLDEQDEIFKVSYDRIFFRKANNDVEIFTIITGENGCTLSDLSSLITKGNNIISTKKAKSNIEFGTF